MKKKKNKEETLKKKRSKAAKKGWETRRKKQLKDIKRRNRTLDRLPKKFSKVTKKKKKKPAPKERKKLEARVTTLEKMLEREKERGRVARNELQRERAALAEQELLATFVDDDSMGWFTKDGKKALRFSKLRMLPGSDKLHADLTKMYEDEDFIEFRGSVEEIADEYDVEVSEVYEFFYSP